MKKEKSWNGWRDENINPLTLDNVPTSGFVLNKKAGGYSTGWNHRQTYVRVYDPRDFEFEISVPNLLYILENTNSIKGKGLEGEFVYGWEGTELVLIPTSSPDYTELSEFNELRHNRTNLKGKDLIIGAAYKSNDNSDLIYLGRFYESNNDNKESKAYFFYNKAGKYSKFIHYKSLGANILDIIDEKCVEDYASLMDELPTYNYYSERDPKKDKYIDYTLEEFIKGFKRGYYSDYFFVDKSTKYFVDRTYRGYWSFSRNETIKYNVYATERNRRGERVMYEVGLTEIFNKYRPKYLVTYKSNGELIKEWRKVSDEK